MKKKLVLTAAVIAALSVVSCNGKKTNSQGADQDSLSYAEMIRSIPTMSFSIPSPAPTRELSLLPTVRASRPF